MKKQLKQPVKYTHAFLRKKSEDSQSEHEPKDANKSKQIEKEKYIRKVITKPHEPSAIRLEEINKTFEKISEKSDSYLQHLNIDRELLQKLANLNEKFVCECKRNVKFYCLRCNQKCTLLQLPPIKLPMAIHVIHHLSEKINKSSVAPFRFLTKDIVFYPFQGKVKGDEHEEENRLSVFEKIPPPSSETFILYPHKNSKSMKEVKGQINNLIVLDCTWFQTDSIISKLQAKGYHNFIKLEGYESVFWRYNHFGQQALCSAESIMFFLREFQQREGLKQNEYDPLMLLYALNMRMVHKSIAE